MPPEAPWPVECVAFDLDGLLVDTERVYAEALRQLLQRRGLSLLPEVTRGMMGTPARQALRHFRTFYPLAEGDDEILAEARGLFFAILDGRPAPLLPGVVTLLDRLADQGRPLALATSSQAVYVRQMLGPHGLLDRFAFVLTCEDVQMGKPFPEIYQKAAARFGVPPAAMAVLEDSPNGLRAAKAAGAWCAVVPHDLVPRDELADADAVVARLDEPRLARLLGLA
jgi:HAD superfamily hydrolase (TIGR01509 family)